MYVVGLTGGVGSGKTTVSQVWKEEGATLIDADQIARELVQPHTPAWTDLIKTFGKEILEEDGSIHRKKLAAIVFSNPEQRRLLNGILHPRIQQEIGRRLEEVGRKDPEAIVVIDAPLLMEAGDPRKMDQVIVVTSTRAQQIERLKKRNGMTEERAQEILSSQMPLEEKVKRADRVIHNEGPLEETKKKAREIFKEIKRRALQKGNHPTLS